MVKFVAIGFEPEHYEDFREGNYFKGKVYLGDKSLYTTAGYKKIGVIRGLFMLCQKRVRKEYQESKTNGIKGNFKGDGLQLGGTMIVTSQGDVISN